MPAQHGASGHAPPVASRQSRQSRGRSRSIELRPAGCSVLSAATSTSTAVSADSALSVAAASLSLSSCALLLRDSAALPLCLSLLPTRDVVLHCTRVCRAWRAACESGLAWRHSHVTLTAAAESAGVQPLLALSRVPARLRPLLRSLDCSVASLSDSPVPKTLHHEGFLLATFARLERVIIRGDGATSHAWRLLQAHFSSCSEACRPLQELTLQNVDGHTAEEWTAVLTHPRLSGLRSLSVNSASLPCEVLPVLSQLTALTLSRNATQRRRGIIHISESKQSSLFAVVHQLTALRTLRVDSCDPGGHVAPRLPLTLTDLAFAGLRLPDSFDFDAAFTPLLNLRRFEGGVSSQLGGRRMLTALARLPRLERLCLRTGPRPIERPSGSEISALVSEFLARISSERPAEHPQLRLTELSVSQRVEDRRWPPVHEAPLIVMEAVEVAAAGSPSATAIVADAALSIVDTSSRILCFPAATLPGMHSLHLNTVPLSPQCLTELLTSIAPHTLRSLQMRTDNATPACWQSPERSVWTFVVNHARTLQHLAIVESLRPQMCLGGFDAVAAAALSQLRCLRSFRLYTPLGTRSCGALVVGALSSLPALVHCDLRADAEMLDSAALRLLASSASLRTLRIDSVFGFSATPYHALALRILEDTAAVECFWLNGQSRGVAELWWKAKLFSQAETVTHSEKPKQSDAPHWIPKPASTMDQTEARKKCAVQ